MWTYWSIVQSMFKSDMFVLFEVLSIIVAVVGDHNLVDVAFSIWILCLSNGANCIVFGILFVANSVALVTGDGDIVVDILHLVTIVDVPAVFKKRQSKYKLSLGVIVFPVIYLIF